MRMLLVVGALLGIFACQFATLFDDDCFRAFSLYPDFPTQLRDTLGGKVSNLILPPGYVVLGATVAAYLCRKIFMCWADRLVKARFRLGQRPKRWGVGNGIRDTVLGRSAGAASDSTAMRVAQLTTGGTTLHPSSIGGKNPPFWQLKQQQEEKARHEALAQQRLAQMAPVLQMQEQQKQQKQQAADVAAKKTAAAAQLVSERAPRAPLTKEAPSPRKKRRN